MKPDAGPAMKSEAKPEAKPSDEPVKVEAWRDSDGLRLTFSFPSVDAGGLVPPRRHGVAGLRFHKRRSTSSRSAPRAARSSARSAGCRSTTGRRSASASTVRRCIRCPRDERSSGTNWTLIFADKVQAPPQPLSVVRNIADPALANVAVPLANRRPAAPARRSRCGRYAHGRHRAAAGPRLHQAAGFRRFLAARFRPWRCDPPELRRRRGRGRAGTKIIIGKPGGLTLSPVDVSAERAPMAVRPLFDVEEWRKNQTAQFHRARICADPGAARAPSRTCVRRRGSMLARFYMARAHVPGSQGRDRSRRSPIPAPKKDESDHADGACGREHPDRPARAGR